MLGILTEKPSAMRNFAKALGGNKGVFDGQEYVIVAARGHMYEFIDVSKQVPLDHQDDYKSWDLENLPWNEKLIAWKRTPIKDTTKSLKSIKDTLSKCDEIAIATDVDPTGEGELLAWEILDELKLHPKKWSRFYFIDESVDEIQKAFRTRKELSSMEEDMDYVKAYFRARWDYLSMQFTRVATKNANGRCVLRQGRLKSAMVNIVGDGLKAIENYKKIPYYQNRFKDENGNVFTNLKEPQYKTKEEVPRSYSKATVVVDSKQKKSTPPPKLLDLAALSSILSARGIKAKEVLAVYQKMYDAQIVSYPRTEDKVITPEQFKELLPLADKIADLVGIDKRLLTHRTPRSTHVKIGGAHGANRPGKNVPKNLSDLDDYGRCAKDIYIILAKNYLATLAPDYEYEQQLGHLKEYPDFKGKADVPLKLGYREIFNDSEETEVEEKSLGTMASPFIHEGFPKKPPTPTMKWLMKQLEKYDVGTGATRTSIYADVTNEKHKFPLLIEQKGKLSMSIYGQMSYVLLEGTAIGDVKTTEMLMSNMRDIAKGVLDADTALADIKKLIMHDMKIMQKNKEKLKDLKVDTQPKEKMTGLFNGKEVSCNRVWVGHRFTDEEVASLFNGETIIIDVTGKGGKYQCKGKLSELEYKGRKYIGFERLEVIGANASANSDKATGVWNGKEVSFKKVWGGHTFTDEEIAKLLAGEEIIVSGLTSKKGKKYSVTGKLAELEYNGNKYIGFEKLGFA